MRSAFVFIFYWSAEESQSGADKHRLSHRPPLKTSTEGYVQKHQTARPPPLPHTYTNPRSKTAPAHLFVVRKQRSLFNLSPPIGPQVLEVVLSLLLTARLCPARSKVFMCQWALFCRGAELNINSPPTHDAPRSRRRPLGRNDRS